ncbi:MAG: hypothetical protein EXR48_03835 [Dehalococcoidia bacterium]|nr:hypothetical protein [Dehalococcoidia bacterium]
MVSQLGIVTLRVDNWEKMLAYYRDTLGLKVRFADDKIQYAMFDTGAVRFALEGPIKPAHAKQRGKPPMMANFLVESLTAAVDELKKRGVKLLTGVKQGPNYDYVVFEDPEGNEQIVYQRVQR